MPPKPKRWRVECLLCHITYDSDYRSRHNEIHHSERAKKHQHIPFEDAGAPENPLKVGSNSIILSLIRTKVRMEAKTCVHSPKRLMILFVFCFKEIRPFSQHRKSLNYHI